MKWLFPIVPVFSASVLLAAPPAALMHQNISAPRNWWPAGQPEVQGPGKGGDGTCRNGPGREVGLAGRKDSQDPEVQTRCQQLLPQALALDLMFRIDRFLKDADGKLEHDLPLWKAYRGSIGSDENARHLFAEMLRANGALLESAEEEPARLSERDAATDAGDVPGVVRQRHPRRVPAWPGESGGDLLCAVCHAPNRPTSPLNRTGCSRSLYHSASVYQATATTRRRASATESSSSTTSTSAWTTTRLHQCVWMFCQHRIKEGADVLAKALKDGKAGQVYTKATALCCVGTLGGQRSRASD